MIKCLCRRLRKSEGGAALIEFALVVPILITLVMGIIEFGWIFNGYITLTGAAREGARLAVINEEEQLIRKAVIDHATIFSEQNLIITFDPELDNTSPGNETKVTVSGQLPLIIGFFPIDNPFSLTAEANMRQEF